MSADKRTDDQALQTVQARNRQWWTDHTMSYDWKDTAAEEPYSKSWFDEIDQRFIHGARLFAHDTAPFNRIIPFDRLMNKKVLEIGCGMGLHTELIVRAGASLVSIDISDTSVAATRRRAEVRGLNFDVRQMDAANLDFADNTFDFVWSWGVIHHSAHTGRIVREIHRVLHPGGEVRAMVYNLNGVPAYVTIATKYLLNFWRGQSLDSCLWASTDGFMARHYSKDTLADLFDIFFRNVSVLSYGQESDAVPLPRYLRKLVLPLISQRTLERVANARGAFLQVTATK